MDRRILWIWISDALKTDARKITYLYDGFDSAEEIFNAGREAYEAIEGLSQEDIGALCDKNLSKAEKTLSYCNSMGAKVLTYEDADYPYSLRKIFDPPYVLYVKGNILPWDRLLCIGVVGTRHATEYGKYAAEELSFAMAKEGVTIVSGMAAGIDSCGHMGALRAKVPTIAVLGCGIDVVYPASNAELEREIELEGAVLTEYPPGTEPKGGNFPRRNRIISGLSQGVLVAEAPIKSGALITADLALSQGKDVFAVPGGIYTPSCSGCNLLISQGAKLVSCAADILEEYGMHIEKIRPSKKEFSETQKEQQSPNQKDVTKKAEKPHLQETVRNVIHVSIEDPMYQDLSEEERGIISVLIEKAASCDELLEKTGFAAPKLLSTLTLLEIKGYVNSLPGKHYTLNLQ